MAAGICLHAHSAAVGQSEKQEQLLGFPQTSMKALPRLPPPSTSRGHCWDRMGASPMLVNLSLLLERWAGGGSCGAGCQFWGEPCSGRAAELQLGLLCGCAVVLGYAPRCAWPAGWKERHMWGHGQLGEPN